jgi:hypothetical protein
MMDEDIKLNEWMMGNGEAVKFLKILGNITQAADDLADQDVHACPASIAHLLHQTMVLLPACDFFLRNAKWFVPLFNTSVSIWSQTDRWAKEDSETAKLFGFVYREHFEQVIVQAALLVAGWDHACYVADDMNKFYHRDSETFKVCKKEHANG